MIYKTLLTSQAREISRLLDEYIASHNKMLQESGTFKSLFQNVDFLAIHKEIDVVKTHFEKKAQELIEIKEDYYGSFADVSMAFFDALENYFHALFEAVSQLHLLSLRLYETSKGFIGNQGKLSWSEYSQLTKQYGQKVKAYRGLGDKLNRAYRELESEPNDFINDYTEETNNGFIQIPFLLIIVATTLFSSIGAGIFVYQRDKIASKTIATVESVVRESAKKQNPSIGVTPVANLGNQTATLLLQISPSSTPTPASATPSPTTATPSPTHIPQPTYACEFESGVRFSTSPCEQQSQKRGKSIWEGSCDAGWNPHLSSDAKLSYRIEKDGSLNGRAYIQIKRPDGEIVFPKQEIQGSGELPIKEIANIAGQYSVTLEQVGVDTNGYSLCTKHTMTLEY